MNTFHKCRGKPHLTWSRIPVITCQMTVHPNTPTQYHQPAAACGPLDGPGRCSLLLLFPKRTRIPIETGWDRNLACLGLEIPLWGKLSLKADIAPLAVACKMWLACESAPGIVQTPADLLVRLLLHLLLLVCLVYEASKICSSWQTAKSGGRGQGYAVLTKVHLLLGTLLFPAQGMDLCHGLGRIPEHATQCRGLVSFTRSTLGCSSFSFHNSADWVWSEAA